GTSNSSASLKYGSREGSLGGIPLSCAPISPTPPNCPEVYIGRILSTAGLPAFKTKGDPMKRSGAAFVHCLTADKSVPLRKPLTILYLSMASNVFWSSASGSVVAWPSPSHGAGRQIAGIPGGTSWGNPVRD